ncbi:MAG: hypothetical protein JXB45_01900 [Candidatus Krumholzibacteriota bacterium]|nr:hypothetical protein [Candidatus Krumholzibacteriota bacterium]
MTVATGKSYSPRQWEATARKSLREGKRGTEVVTRLVGEGLDSESAWKIVEEAVTTLRSRASTTFGLGLVFCILGLCVSIGTYSAAASNPNGGGYFIWWGPVVCGGIAALVGILRLIRFRM